MTTNLLDALKTSNGDTTHHEIEISHSEGATSDDEHLLAHGKHSNHIVNVHGGDEGTTSTNPFDALFSGQDDPESYMGVYETLRYEISKIDENAREVHILTDNYVMASDITQDDKLTMDKLEKIMQNNHNTQKLIRSLIEKEKNKNEKLLLEQEKKNIKGSTVLRWRQNQLNTQIKMFDLNSRKFHAALNEFNKEKKNKTKRLIKIINIDKNSKMNEEKIDELVEKNERINEYLVKQLQLEEPSDEFLEYLESLEKKHEGVTKIRDSMLELQELFTELNQLITEQQELLDNIESNVQDTGNYVKSGVKHLEKAEKHQVCTRKLQFCMCCICVIVLLVVMIVYLSDSDNN